MNQTQIDNNNTAEQISRFSSHLERLFWLLALLHLCLWSILPVFIRHATTGDLIEALTWGRQFEWGYDKNPFLVGSLAYLGGLFGNSGIGIYFIQQLFILLGIWSVKQLTLKLTNNRSYAFISATVLLIVFCFNFEVQINNDNYVLQGLLPLSALFFYDAIKKQSLKYWFFSAISLGLATLAKYSAVIFLPLYTFFLLLTKNRKYFLSSKPYLALLLYGFMLLPHLIWLYQHNFTTINYAFLARGELHQHSHLQYLGNHIVFLLSILIELFPVTLLLLTAIEYRKRSDINFLAERDIVFKLSENSERFFIYLFGLAPIILLFTLANMFGFSLRLEWIDPFLCFLVSIFFVIFQPTISQRSITRYTLCLITLMLGIVLGYIMVSKQRHVGSYPAPEIAKFATQLWHKYYKKRLLYVAGDRYTAGYIAYYSTDKPQVWMEWNMYTSPWIVLNRLRCEGALFVIEHGHPAHQWYTGINFPTLVQKQFPRLIVFPLQSFKWYHNVLKEPVTLRFGFLPPDKSYCGKQ